MLLRPIGLDRRSYSASEQVGSPLYNDCASRFLGTHGIGALPLPKLLFCGRLSSKSVSFFSLAQLDLPIRPLIAFLLLNYSINFTPCAIDKGINMRSYSFGSRYAMWVLDKSVRYFRTKHTDILKQGLRHKSANTKTPEAPHQNNPFPLT